jgi:hypothetical protein
VENKDHPSREGDKPRFRKISKGSGNMQKRCKLGANSGCWKAPSVDSTPVSAFQLFPVLISAEVDLRTRMGKRAFCKVSLHF